MHTYTYSHAQIILRYIAESPELSCIVPTKPQIMYYLLVLAFAELQAYIYVLTYVAWCDASEFALAGPCTVARSGARSPAPSHGLSPPLQSCGTIPRAVSVYIMHGFPRFGVGELTDALTHIHTR